MNGKRFLVPVNGSAVSEDAFRWACRLAKHSKAELHAIYVNEVPMEFSLTTEFVHEDNLGEHVLARLEAIADEEKCKVHAQILQSRHAGPAIVLEAEDRQMDVVIVGLPYRNRVGFDSLGTTAKYLLDHTPCQVILWRERIPAAILAHT